MQRFCRIAAIAISTVLAQHGGVYAQSTDGPVELIIPPAVQDVLSSHVQAQNPPNLLTSLSAVQTIDHKGNFGRKVEAKLAASLTRLDNGLIGSQSSIVVDGGKAVSRGTGVSLCGLIPLLTESQSTTDTSSTTVLPVGKIFVPFGMKANVDFANRRRVVAIATSAPSLCMPSAGQEFTLKTEEELTIKSTGIFGLASRTNQIKRVQDSKCRAALDLKPASQIGPALAGEYREVQCETVDADGKASRTRYAYLVSSNHYLAIEEVNEWQSATTIYPTASYVKVD